MNALAKLSILSFVVGLYAGCSPVGFSMDDSQCRDEGCIVQNGQYAFKYDVQVGKGKVDILIVNDNSASMSFEQARLAPRFQNFIQELDSQNSDYRIAMTTTDISNGRGGKLIDFGSGKKFITPSDSNRQALFSSAIQRSETLKCESFMTQWISSGKSTATSEYTSAYNQNCPSGDERGIYAASLVVENNPSSFIRNDSHLAIIFLTDEDVRSGLYKVSSQFALASKDQPNYLVNEVKKKYGNDKFNSLTVHSIIVKDNACLVQQNSQINGVQGSIGEAYKLFETSQWGKTVDICSTDYTSQLGQIRSYISNRIKDIVLKCYSPTELIVTVSGSNIPYTLEGKTVKFSTYLNPGTNVSLSYKCSVLN